MPSPPATPYRLKVSRAISGWLRAHFRLNRMAGHGGAALCVFAGFVTFNAVFSFALSNLPEEAPVPSRYAWEEFQDIGGRVAHLERLLSEDTDGPGYALFVGSSSTRVGVSARMLENTDGLDLKWLVLAGGGLDFSDLGYLLRPVNLLRQSPRLVVLGTHPFLLARDSENPSDGIPDRSPTAVRRIFRLMNNVLIQDPLYRIGSDLEPSTSWPRLARDAVVYEWQWQIENLAVSRVRTYTRLWLRHLAYRFRLRTLGLLGHGARGLFPEKPYHRGLPWGNIAPGFFDALQYRGRLNAESYARDNPSAERLADLIEWLQSLGSKTLVVLMPEHSSVRGIQPEEGLNLLESIVAESSSSFDKTILDTRDWMEDEHFADTVHLKERESKWAFSEQLGPALGRHLSAETLAPSTGVDTPPAP